jgi:hypothetical protein
MLVNIIKFGVGAVASVSTSVVVRLAVESVKPDNLTKVGKALVGVGGFVISCVVGEAAMNYTDELIDGVVNGVENIKERFNSKKEVSESKGQA